MFIIRFLMLALLFTGFVSSAALADEPYLHGDYDSGHYRIEDEGVRFATFTFRGTMKNSSVEKAVKSVVSNLKEENKTRKSMNGNGNTANIGLGDDKVLVLLWVNSRTGSYGWVASDKNYKYLRNDGAKGNVPNGDWVPNQWDVNGSNVKMWMGRNGGTHTYQVNVGE